MNFKDEIDKINRDAEDYHGERVIIIILILICFIAGFAIGSLVF